MNSFKAAIAFSFCVIAISCAQGGEGGVGTGTAHTSGMSPSCAGTLLFDCESGGERINLCLSHSNTELTLTTALGSRAQNRTMPVTSAFYAAETYSGGGEEQVVLELVDRKLVLFGKSVSRFDGDGKSGADFSDGFFELKGGKVASSRECERLQQPIYGKAAAPVLRAGRVIPH